MWLSVQFALGTMVSMGDRGSAQNRFDRLFQCTTGGDLSAGTVVAPTRTNLGKSGSQTHCPITGMKLEKRDAFIDYQGQRIYLCCSGCKDMFLKNPEAALGKLEKREEVPENVQKTCPVCDAPVHRRVGNSADGWRYP